MTGSKQGQNDLPASPAALSLLPSNQAGPWLLSTPFNKVFAERGGGGEGAVCSGHLQARREEGSRLRVFSMPPMEFLRNFPEDILAIRNDVLEGAAGPLSPLGSSCHRPRAMAESRGRPQRSWFLGEYGGTP